LAGQRTKLHVPRAPPPSLNPVSVCLSVCIVFAVLGHRSGLGCTASPQPVLLGDPDASNPSQVVYDQVDGVVYEEDIDMYAHLSCALTCLLLVSHPLSLLPAHAHLVGVSLQRGAGQVSGRCALPTLTLHCTSCTSVCRCVTARKSFPPPETDGRDVTPRAARLAGRRAEGDVQGAPAADQSLADGGAERRR
jgi:hypothetical protein